jgi:hypothetical protein
MLRTPGFETVGGTKIRASDDTISAGAHTAVGRRLCIDNQDGSCPLQRQVLL